MEQKKYQIEVQGTGKQFFCGEHEFVLEAMRHTGCGPIHYGCFGGGCGICKMKIVSGDYSIEKKMSRAHITEGEQENGIVLLCCVKPRGNLTLAGI